MYPRTIEDRTFCIPVEHKKSGYINVIIAHELLHFIFYDYLYSLYPRLKAIKHNFLCWHVSEIFNTLVQNSEQWLKVFKVRTMGYPEHMNIVNALRRKYKDKINSDNLETVVDDIRQIVEEKCGE